MTYTVKELEKKQDLKPKDLINALKDYWVADVSIGNGFYRLIMGLGIQLSKRDKTRIRNLVIAGMIGQAELGQYDELKHYAQIIRALK